MKKHTANTAHISQVFAALLIGVIAVPTAMTGLFQSVDSTTTPEDAIYQSALQDRVRVRQARREYWQAVDVYNTLRSAGVEGIYRPEINDPESIRLLLDSENFLKNDDFDEPVFSAAPAENTKSKDLWVEYDALLEQHRDLLDGYISTRRCPDTLKQYHVEGFYDLCQRLLDETIATSASTVLQRGAYMRDLIPAQQSPVQTLRQRLQMLEESLNGASIRPQGTPGQHRPRLDYSIPQ